MLEAMRPLLCTLTDSDYDCFARARILVKSFGMVAYAKERYGGMSLSGMQGSWYPGGKADRARELTAEIVQVSFRALSLCHQVFYYCTCAGRAGRWEGGYWWLLNDVCARQACAANPMKDDIPAQLEEMHTLLTAK